MYHLVCSAKYRQVVFDEEADVVLKQTCEGIEKRYEIRFLEIGTDKDHVHFLIQSVPMYSPTKIVKMVKSVTARRVFEEIPKMEEKLWGGEFWGKGYFINTVSQHGNESTIAEYVREQGVESEYKVLHKAQMLFDF